jgi:integrase/recombinase XerD
LQRRVFINQRPKIALLKFERKVLETFTPAQVKALLAFIPRGANETRAYVVASLLLDTGLRISEALGLRRTDCDLDNLVLKVLRKGNKQQLVPMSFEMRKVLWR